MNCVNCNSKPIANVHFKLCIYCNKSRLNHEKQSKQPKRTPKRKTPIHLNAKKIFRTLITSQRQGVCTGCGCTKNLTISHTIPVSIRKDLEFVAENVHLECMECHTIWEHGSITQKKKLPSYLQKIEYIKSIDLLYFERKFNV